MKNDCYIRRFEIRLDIIKVQQSRPDVCESHKFYVIIGFKPGTTFRKRGRTLTRREAQRTCESSCSVSQRDPLYIVNRVWNRESDPLGGHGGQ